MKLTVDRVEGNIVVCENEKREIVEVDIYEFINIPKDGDIVKVNENGMYEILEEETENRKEEIQKRFSSLFKK